MDKFGQPPVVTSVLYAQPEVVSYLIDHGASPEVTDVTEVSSVAVVNTKYPSLAATMLDK